MVAVLTAISILTRTAHLCPLQIHKMLKWVPQLTNEPLDAMGNTALHIAVEVANESAVALLLVQCEPEGAQRTPIAPHGPALLCNEPPSPLNFFLPSFLPCHPSLPVSAAKPTGSFQTAQGRTLSSSPMTLSTPRCWGCSPNQLSWTNEQK